MSFFKKLKDRMFKSSSRLDAGLEAIVEDGGAVEEATPDERPAPPAEVAEAPEAVPASEPEPAPAAEPSPDLTEPPRPDAPAERPSEPEQAPIGTAPAPVSDLPPGLTEPPRPDTPPAPVAPEEAAPPPAAELPPEVAEAEAPGPVAPPRPALPPEVARAEAPARAAPPEPPAPSRSTPAAPPPATPEALQETAPEPAPAKPGLFGRLFGRSEGPVLRRTLDDAMLEELEDLLITADMGVETAARVTANLAEGRLGRKMSVAEIKSALAQEVARIMDPVARPMPLYPKHPQVVLVVGVNGSGKTTTIGKLASQFRAAGKSVVIAAGDTFRAAAVEQLQVWGQRAGVPVMTAPEGSDPASLAFDAMSRAEAEGADLLMIDTAGRLQNRQDLMEELAKIVRVIRKKDPSAPHNTLLVLDATTGQNALTQVEVFRQVADVSGLVMTKLDGTARGGVLVALADRFGLPIHAIGVGEQIDDLSPFDPEEFAAALVGLETE